MMPAGVYYIGDLCFVFSNEEWEELRSLVFKDGQFVEGEYELSDGRKFAIYATKYGNGVCKDQYGETYCIESGTIGCIWLNAIKSRKLFDFKSLGVIVDFVEEFKTLGCNDRKMWNGNILFGGLCIKTERDRWFDADVE